MLARLDVIHKYCFLEIYINGSYLIYFVLLHSLRIMFRCWSGSTNVLCMTNNISKSSDENRLKRILVLNDICLYVQFIYTAIQITPSIKTFSERNKRKCISCIPQKMKNQKKKNKHTFCYIVYLL